MLGHFYSAVDNVKQTGTNQDMSKAKPKKRVGDKSPKRREDVAVMVRMEPDLADFLKSVAESRAVSVSSCMRSILRVLADAFDDPQEWERWSAMLVDKLADTGVIPDAVVLPMRDDLRQMLDRMWAERAEMRAMRVREAESQGA
jgi:hypothetical protein